jgi:hypothetical protein
MYQIYLFAKLNLKQGLVKQFVPSVANNLSMLSFCR